MIRCDLCCRSVAARAFEADLGMELAVTDQERRGRCWDHLHFGAREAKAGPLAERWCCGLGGGAACAGGACSESVWRKD